MTQFVSHALPGLPLAPNPKYPVLIYSSSWGGRGGNTDKAVELASHGYVVVALDHMAMHAAVFPNGQIVYGTPLPNGTADIFTECQVHLTNGIKDILFVLDELSRPNPDDALFEDRLDFERLGVFGFSLGSVIAAEFCRIDARCKAVVMFDSGCILEGALELNRLGLQKPFLQMNSTAEEGWLTAPGLGPWLASATNLFVKATNDAFWFQIQNSWHQSFADKGALINNPPGTGDPTTDSRSQSETIRACTLSFFNKYLKGEDDHLLEDPAAVYSNIINFRRK